MPSWASSSPGRHTKAQPRGVLLWGQINLLEIRPRGYPRHTALTCCRKHSEGTWVLSGPSSTQANAALATPPMQARFGKQEDGTNTGPLRTLARWLCRAGAHLSQYPSRFQSLANS
eukprot:836577-Pelagomonas_calceolata.AAC.1